MQTRKGKGEERDPQKRDAHQFQKVRWEGEEGEEDRAIFCLFLLPSHPTVEECMEVGEGKMGRENARKKKFSRRSSSKRWRE